MKYKISRKKIAQALINCFERALPDTTNQMITDLLATKEVCDHEYGVYKEGVKCIYCGKKEPKNNQASQKEGVSRSGLFTTPIIAPKETLEEIGKRILKEPKIHFRKFSPKPKECKHLHKDHTDNGWKCMKCGYSPKKSKCGHLNWYSIEMTGSNTRFCTDCNHYFCKPSPKPFEIEPSNFLRFHFDSDLGEKVYLETKINQIINYLKAL